MIDYKPRQKWYYTSFPYGVVLCILIITMSCNLRETLTTEYVRALDLVDRAKHRVCTAVTRTNIECAATELRRVEEYRLDSLRLIAEHCESHGCATQELEAICGLELVPQREMVA